MRKGAVHTSEEFSSRNGKLTGQATMDGGCGSNKFQRDVDRGTFVILRKLRVQDLPTGWRHQETLDVIKRVAQRVVRIRIPRLSTRRPVNIYSDHAQYGGTGFAYYVDPQVVKVRTNMHVVFNEEEARSAIIDFFLDLPDRKKPQRIQIRGSKHDFDWSTSEDYASITCMPTAKFLEYLDVFTDTPILWETSFFQDMWRHDQETFPKRAECSSVVQSDGRRVGQFSEASGHCEQFVDHQEPVSEMLDHDRDSKGGVWNGIDLKDRSMEGRRENVFIFQSLMTNEDAEQEDGVKRSHHGVSCESSTNDRFVTDEVPKHSGSKFEDRKLSGFLSEAEISHTECFLEEKEDGEYSKVNLHAFPDEISVHGNAKTNKAGRRTEKLGHSLASHTSEREIKCGMASHADRLYFQEREGIRKQKRESAHCDYAQKPEGNSSNGRDRSRATAGRRLASDPLEPDDYVIILSHPNGGEKCFSVGQAFVFQSLGVAARTVPAGESSDAEQQGTAHGSCRATASSSSDCRLEGERACFTFPKRMMGLNRDRYYSTQSSYGCSGAPILILKHSLRHLKIPILDTSQHSGTCFLQNGLTFGFATAFMPALYGSSRCPDRVSETALLHFAATGLNEDSLPRDKMGRTDSHHPTGFRTDRTQHNEAAMAEQKGGLETSQRMDVTGRSDRGDDISAGRVNSVDLQGDWQWTTDCPRNHGTLVANFSKVRSVIKETEQDRDFWGGQECVARGSGRAWHVEKYFQAPEAKRKTDSQILRNNKTLTAFQLGPPYSVVDRGSFDMEGHGGLSKVHDKRSVCVLEVGASNELARLASPKCRRVRPVGHSGVKCDTNNTCQISVARLLHPSIENFQVFYIGQDTASVQVDVSKPFVEAQNVQFDSDVASPVENVNTIPRSYSPRLHQHLLVQNLAKTVTGTDQRDLLVTLGMQTLGYGDEETRDLGSACPGGACSTNTGLSSSLHHLLDEERQLLTIPNWPILSTNVGRSEVPHDVTARSPSCFVLGPSDECFHRDKNTLSMSEETNQSLHKTVNPVALSTRHCLHRAIPRANPAREGEVSPGLRYLHDQSQDFLGESSEEPYPGFLCDIRGQLVEV